MRTVTTAVALVMAGVAIVGVGAAPVAAGDKDYVCEKGTPGELCLYSLPGLQGSLIDYLKPDLNYGNDFMSNGEVAADNAESVFNGDGSNIALAFTGPNFTGMSIAIRPNQALLELGLNFSNNLESSTWVLPPSGP